MSLTLTRAISDSLIFLSSYSEREVKPYIRDIISETLKNNKRLFLSHFTSTTHHPWALPNGFERVNYFGSRKPHEDLDDFLNTVHFSDVWLGELLGLLDEKGIANETLVVVVGDQ